MVSEAPESLTIQVSHVRWAEAGRGAIVLGLPLGATQRPEGEPLPVRMGANALGGQTALQGDVWRLVGQFETFRGRRQFSADAAILLRPYGQNLIETLRGPRFKGVGLAKAKALWDRFGLGLRDVLEEGEVDRLTEVVSPEVAQVLIEGWQKLNPGEVIEWLDQHRLPITLGQKLLHFYGSAAADKVRADPYRLLAFGESWERVDKVALEKLGIGQDDGRREHAAVAEALYRAHDREGSTALEHDELVVRVARLLSGDELQATRAVGAPKSGGGWLRDADSGLYQSSGAWLMERYVADRLGRMITGEDLPKQADLLQIPAGRLPPDLQAKVAETLKAWQADHIRLGEQQKQAVWLALNQQVSVISGGAGVGKTTVLRAIYAGLDVIGSEVRQMALAGRAAKRMADATGRRAMTIAGFLRACEQEVTQGRGDIDPYTERFDRDGSDPRTYVVDEASMLDLSSLYKILRWIGPGGRLILIGDDMQLPPIGAGLTFHLLCQPEMPVKRLHLAQVYRQEGSTGIPTISQAIRDGSWPKMPTYSGPGVGVSLLPCSEAETADVIARLYDELVDAERTASEVQILATNRGDQHRPGTVVHLNADLYSRRLAGRTAVMLRGNLSGYSEGCPILFTRNDWKRVLADGSQGVLNNGSLGEIISAFPESVARQEDQLVPAAQVLDADGNLLPPSERLVCEALIDGERHYLSEDDVEFSLQRAFGITVHKAQGSQWNRVIVPISPGRLLDRTLVYTAVTRAVRQVVLVGNLDAAEQAVHEAPIAMARKTSLVSMLRAMADQQGLNT